MILDIDAHFEPGEGWLDEQKWLHEVREACRGAMWRRAAERRKGGELKGIEKGIDGHFPTQADWDLHQTSVFPEVRIKRTIEIRGADCVDHEMALAFCALFTGMLYCNIALDEGTELVKEFEKHGNHEERFEAACREGLEATIGGRTIADWASDLGAIAERGLKACLPDDLDKIYPLVERMESGRSPADDILEAWNTDPSPENVIQAYAY